MRSRFMLVPAAIIAAGPAVALEFQTLEQAQARLFPGATFAPADFTLTGDQVNRIETELRVPVLRPQVRAWRASTGGWLILDQVIGLDDRITYAVAIGDDGVLKGIEILVCVEGFCEIADPKWNKQLVGRKHQAADFMPEINLV